MRKLINAMLASLFIFAVLAAIPQYSDFIDNPGKAVTSGPQVPEIYGFLGITPCLFDKGARQ